MTLYRLDSNRFEPVPETTFEREELTERGDLQRILRDHPEVLGDDLFIISEEFSDWEDSRLRIDLLALSTDGTLVVVELKRTQDGGHMELQAIRYAAMVANLTFEQLVETHQRYLDKRALDRVARTSLVEFLHASDEDEPTVDSLRPRILLVSGDFSRELTTSVLWLNDMGLDIRCIRLQPYRMGEDCIVDAQQIIPLPESEDYLVRVRNRAAETRARDYPTLPWSFEDIEKLSAKTTNRSIIVLLDLCADTPDKWISFIDVIEKGGRTRNETRGDLAWFTRFVKSQFRRQNWPVEVEWGAGGEEQIYYRLGSDLAGWWRTTRKTLSGQSG